jgi:site-specific DNA-methyltransferase (adenine-specific)
MNDIFNENVPLKTETPAFAKHVLGAVPSVVYNEDCVEGLKRFSDNHFDLAIVDPPYGIGASEMQMGNNAKKKWSKGKSWDNETPSAEYWQELFRVSKNQIVWGGNYFELPLTKGWIVWDKNNGESGFADGEMAWTSFNKPMKIKKYIGLAQLQIGKTQPGKIHPTQKPVALYDWILEQFGSDANLILDTHVGSGSRLACNELHFAFTGFEIDKDYYESQEKRFKDFVSQLRMF